MSRASTCCTPQPDWLSTPELPPDECRGPGANSGVGRKRTVELPLASDCWWRQTTFWRLLAFKPRGRGCACNAKPRQLTFLRRGQDVRHECLPRAAFKHAVKSGWQPSRSRGEPRARAGEKRPCTTECSERYDELTQVLFDRAVAARGRATGGPRRACAAGDSATDGHAARPFGCRGVAAERGFANLGPGRPRPPPAASPRPLLPRS